MNIRLPKRLVNELIELLQSQLFLTETSTTLSFSAL